MEYHFFFFSYVINVEMLVNGKLVSYVLFVLINFYLEEQMWGGVFEPRTLRETVDIKHCLVMLILQIALIKLTCFFFPSC